VRAVIFLLLVATPVPVLADTSAPVVLRFTEPELVEGTGGAEVALVTTVGVCNLTDEPLDGWSGTLQWLEGRPGMVLCSTPLVIEESLHENWPSEIQLELSTETRCESGVLTEVEDSAERLREVHVGEVWLRVPGVRSGPAGQTRLTAPLGESALSPALVESVLGGNEHVKACLLQAVEAGYAECGKIWVELTILPDGSIRDVSAARSCVEGWSSLENCLCAAIGACRFPPLGGPTRVVKYPYSVRP
jgi:hypothetical protein